MHFYIQWPDEELMQCYSPSTVIREYFEPGMSLTIAELREKTAEALERASERVRAKYGVACVQSSNQSEEIQARARLFRDEETVGDRSCAPQGGRSIPEWSPAMTHDVVTVGGGLAGSALAITLARQGVRVLVLEKETQFRDRVRGEGLLPWGVNEARASRNLRRAR